MNRNKLLLFSSFAVMALTVLFACKKDIDETIPAEQAHFARQSSASYFITAPGVQYNIPVGLTTVSSVDRTIKVSVTSPSGAVAGTHYTIDKTMITIPAGKVVDSITVTGDYNRYITGRKDTLIFRIEGVDKGSTVVASDYNAQFTLYMRGPCFEGEIATDILALVGDYKNTKDTLSGAFTYGPYTTTVKSATITSATTATIVVSNLYDEGWNDLTFTLDWTDLNNRKVTLMTQNAGGNAGNTFGATQNAKPYGITPDGAGRVGTFSFCNQTITIKANIGVFGVGYVPNLYTVAMRR